MPTTATKPNPARAAALDQIRRFPAMAGPDGWRYSEDYADTGSGWVYILHRDFDSIALVFDANTWQPVDLTPDQVTAALRDARMAQDDRRRY